MYVISKVEQHVGYFMYFVLFWPKTLKSSSLINMLFFLLTPLLAVGESNIFSETRNILCTLDHNRYHL